MSPFYQVSRADVSVGSKDFGWQALDVRELGNGRHEISVNGITIPITIEGDKVTVHLSEAEGDLNQATISGMGDDWVIDDRKRLLEVKFGAEDGDAPIHIYRKGDNPSVCIEYHNQLPETFDLQRRL